MTNPDHPELMERALSPSTPEENDDRCVRAGYHVCGPGHEITADEADVLRRIVDRYGNHFRRDEDFYIALAALENEHVDSQDPAVVDEAGRER